MSYAPDDDPYVRIAPIYDFVTGPLLLAVRNNIRRRVLEERCEDVVDLCCGTGSQAIMLDRSGIRVTGIDLSSAMLRIASAKVGSRTEWRQLDAANTHFEDEHFGCAIISFALHEKDTATRLKVLAEAQRIVRRSGKLIIADFCTRDRASQRLAGRLVVDPVERLAGREHFINYLSYMADGALEGTLRRSGLKVTKGSSFYFGTTAVLVIENWV